MKHAPSLRILAVILGFVTLLGLLAPSGAAASVADEDPGNPDGQAYLVLVHRIFDSVLNDLERDVAEVRVADDAVIATPYGTFAGPQGLIDYATAVRQVYPDASFEVTNIAARGDTLEVSWLMTASQVRHADQVFDFNIVLEGVTTMVVDGHQVSGVSQENAVVADGAPQVVASVPHRGQAY